MGHPRLDERLVTPETREEMLRGELLHAMPANPPHAEQHTRLDYVVEGHVAPGYIVATDMLTRAGPGSDFATDTAVRKEGTDPATGTRYLEEVAFEVVSTQTMREMIMRAEDLTARGVRRLFGIFVERDEDDHDLTRRVEVREWSQAEHRFVVLSPDSEIQDPTFARPLPVRALIDRVQADNAVVDALESKDNPRLRSIKSREHTRGQTQGCQEGRQEGQTQGRIEAIESVCLVLDIELTPARAAYLRGLDASGLQGLLSRLRTERRWPD